MAVAPSRHLVTQCTRCLVLARCLPRPSRDSTPITDRDTGFAGRLCDGLNESRRPRAPHRAARRQRSDQTAPHSCGRRRAHLSADTLREKRYRAVRRRIRSRCAQLTLPLRPRDSLHDGTSSSHRVSVPGPFRVGRVGGVRRGAAGGGRGPLGQCRRRAPLSPGGAGRAGPAGRDGGVRRGRTSARGRADGDDRHRERRHRRVRDGRRDGQSQRATNDVPLRLRHQYGVRCAGAVSRRGRGLRPHRARSLGVADRASAWDRLPLPSRRHELARRHRGRRRTLHHT